MGRRKEWDRGKGGEKERERTGETGGVGNGRVWGKGGRRGDEEGWEGQEGDTPWFLFIPLI